MDNRKEIYKTFPEPISLKQTEKIIEQMNRNNNICRINVMQKLYPPSRGV